MLCVCVSIYHVSVYHVYHVYLCICVSCTCVSLNFTLWWVTLTGRCQLCILTDRLEHFCCKWSSHPFPTCVCTVSGTVTHPSITEAGFCLSLHIGLERWLSSRKHYLLLETPWLQIRHPHCHSKPFGTTVPGDPNPSFGLWGQHLHVVHRPLYRQNTQDT